MNRAYHLLLPVCLIIALLASCSKPYKKPADEPPTTYSTGGPTTFPVIPLNELFKDFRYNPEVQCIAAGVLDTVTFSKGTRVIFYPWSFQDATGDTIVGAMVCVSAVEVYKPGDMIQNRTVSTSTAGDLLRNTGQVLINATVSGQKVFANKYAVAFKQPAPSLKRMDLFYGNALNVDSVTAWTMPDSVGPGTTALATTIDSFYHFDSGAKFGWVNSGQVFDTTTLRTDINIALTDAAFDARITSVFVVFPSINAVATATYSKKTRTFLLGGDAKHKVPVGMKVNVIIISRSQGNYYYFEQDGVRITDGMFITASLTMQTFDYIRTKLWAL